MTMKRVLLAALVLALASFGVSDDRLGVHNVTMNGVAQGCRSCHIPHGGSIAGSPLVQRNTIFGSGGLNDPTTGVAKLWDKNFSQGSWTTYSSDIVLQGGSVLAKADDKNDPSWHSFLCFSCHDGVAAQLNLPPTNAANILTNGAILFKDGSADTDLMNDHPVDLQWPTDSAASRYEDPAVVIAGGNSVKYPDVQAMPLYSGKIECSTCHNPHVQPVVTLGSVPANFLRVTTVADNTSLCRNCHKDKR